MVRTYHGPPDTTYGPMPAPPITVSEPHIYRDRIEIDWQIGDDDTSCGWTPLTVFLPSFAPEWGTLTGVQVGQNLEVSWLEGCEYETPSDSRGAMACFWYAPDHGGQWWPTRSDVGTPGDGHWDCEAVIAGVPLSYTIELPLVGYAQNDAGLFPRGPYDGAVDWAGTSGGTSGSYDGLGAHDWGQATSDPNLLASVQHGAPVGLSCNLSAYVSWTISILGTTHAMAACHAVQRGTLVYWREP
ncbi:MAG: hypothetical protein GY856_36960 [bacterium]|nr:hypothetical protein [bacterium]